MEKNYLLHKYLNGEASKEDLEILQEDPEFAHYIAISESTSYMEVPQFKERENFEEISHKIKGNSPKVRKLNPLTQIIRVAAVVAVVVTSYIFLNNRETTVRTDIAQRETFSLPDQSEVTLNAASEISYHKKNWDESRNLDLKGEAFFKVEKGAKFSVNTPQGVVSVLGTQFNVFSRGNDFQIKCFEGLVSVAYKDTLVKVPAGNYLVIKENQFVSYSSIQTQAPSWIDFESSFENSDLSMVLEELKRQFPVTIDNQIELEKKFTGSFTHKDLNVALRSICEPLQLQFTVKDNVVTIYAENSR